MAFVWLHTWIAALWTFALVVFHEISDQIVGFYYNIVGPESPQIGFGFYHSAPVAAVGIELVLAVACVWWFTH